MSDKSMSVHNKCDLLSDPNGETTTFLNHHHTIHSSVETIEPKVFRMLEKVSNTIDKNEERCEENEKKEQHEMEWKQVALVIGTVLHHQPQTIFNFIN